jgi:hypothetical protein
VRSFDVDVGVRLESGWTCMVVQQCRQSDQCLEAEMKQDLHQAFTHCILDGHKVATSLQDSFGIPQRVLTKAAPSIDGPCLNDTGEADSRDCFIAGAAAQRSSMPVIARIRAQGSASMCSQVRRAGRTARTLLCCCLYRASAPGSEIIGSTHACHARVIDMLEGS